MVGLLSLSNELLIQVFTSCTTIESAMSLSRVDKTLHSIWLKYNGKITRTVLQRQIPEYENAVDLAILEQVWITRNTQLAAPPFSKVTTQLLHNAKLATSATNARTVRLLAGGGNVPDILKICSPNHTSLHTIYYLMRTIALSYLHPEARLQRALCATLRAYSKEDVGRLDMFCTFLRCGDAGDRRERDKHGIDKPW